MIKRRRRASSLSAVASYFEVCLVGPLVKNKLEKVQDRLGNALKKIAGYGLTTILHLRVTPGFLRMKNNIG